MKFTVEHLPESHVKLDITAEEPEFAEAVDKAARKVARDIAVPGFRKGKVPRQMIERLYGREIFLEEAGRLIMDDLYRQAIEQEDLTPVGNPDVEITQMDPIAFTVNVPVYPTVDPGDYTSVRVESRDAGIEESDVDEVLQRLRTSSSPWVDPTKERKPVEGDQVTLDLAIFDGDDPFQDPIEDAQFIIGESQLFEGLRDAILKLKPGETGEANLSFDEDDEAAAEKLRGKTLRYEVTLKGIKTRELLDVDDEFAKTYAGEETADDLIAAIRKDLHEGKTKETRTAVLNEIIDKIGEGATIEIPGVMVDDAVKEEIGRTRQRLQMQRTSLEAYLRSIQQTEDDFAAELRPEVARRLRNSLVLQQIAKNENIEISDEELDAEIDKIVSAAPDPEKMAAVYSAERYMRNVIRNEMYDEKLSDHLIGIATEGKGAVTNAYDPDAKTASKSTGGKKATGKKAKAADDEGKQTVAGSVEGTGEAECPDGFPIKGNDSSKIYHLPGQGSYDQTIPEICFATEDDATNAGFRVSKAKGAVADAADDVAEAMDEAK